RRLRPLVGNDAPICVARDPQLGTSYSYPSGHAAVGWAWGLALAEAQPERAAAILKRAQAIGDSRVVCGLHYPSDVTAGRIVRAGVVAVEHDSAEFRADLVAAKAEIDARRAQALAIPVCAAESAALASPAF